MSNRTWKTLSGFNDLHYPVLDGYEPQYVVLSKAGDGTFIEFARCSTATEGWARRNELAASNPQRKFFLRMQLTEYVGPSHADAREDRDLWQDAWKTGRDYLVPADQQTEYKKWAAKKTVNKYARFQVDRDAPRWD